MLPDMLVPGSNKSKQSFMALYIDYHVHSDNSFDCKIPMDEMCCRAVARGISELAFTDHFNNHLLDIDLGYYDPERYFADLERCRAQFPTLTIRAGIEVGEPHRWGSKILPILQRYPYDLVLGSLHWVGNQNVFNPDYFRGQGPQKAYGDYFAELNRMVRHGGFDILAHVDLPKRAGFNVYGSYDIGAYEEAVRDLWQSCIESQIAVEINTKGVRCRVAQLHPTTAALKWYVEMGGQLLTLGSDAHHSNNVGEHFDQAIQSAHEAGLTHVCRFQCRTLIGWSAL